jgi:hypothetical protein
VSKKLQGESQVGNTNPNGEELEAQVSCLRGQGNWHGYGHPCPGNVQSLLMAFLLPVGASE